MIDKLKKKDGVFLVEEVRLKHGVYPKSEAETTVVVIKRTQHPKLSQRVVDIVMSDGQFFVEMACGHIFAVPFENVAKWHPVKKPPAEKVAEDMKAVGPTNPFKPVPSKKGKK